MTVNEVSPLESNDWLANARLFTGNLRGAELGVTY